MTTIVDSTKGSGPGRSDSGRGAGTSPDQPRPTVPGGSGSPSGGNGRTGAGSFSGSVFPPESPIRITARVARRLLREVVAEYGRHHKVDHDREANVYFAGDCPVCMIGCALYRAGFTEDELSRMDGHEPTVIGEVRLPGRVRMSVQARSVFRAAQAAQDDGMPWGAALEAALAVRPWQRQAVAA